MAFRRSQARVRAHPGPQRLLRRNLLGPLYVSVLVALTSLLVVQAFVAANANPAGWPLAWFWRLKLLDMNNAVTLLIALLSLIAVRQQFIYGTKPFLIYFSRFSHDSALGLPRISDRERAWSVTVQNVGQGAASVRSTRYRLALGGSSRPQVRDGLSAGEVQEILSKHGLVAGKHYSMATLSDGARIAAGGEQVVFEIRADCAKIVTALDLHLTFEAMLGDRFEKYIFCIPRDGLS